MLQENPKPAEPPAPGGGTMLRTSMTCSKLREWVRLAQPNARLTYGEGSVLAHACTPEVRELVMALSTSHDGKGMLTPHFVRGHNGEPSRYIVQRTARPYLNGMDL